MLRNVETLTRRELAVYFYSPIAYVVLTVFLVVSGIFFGTDGFVPGNPASLRVVLGSIMPLILVFVLPMLTMRLLSEELSSGTIETLMTAPITDTEVVMGKFLGAYLFYMVMLASTLLYVVLIASFGPLDWGQAACTYLGLLLLGALYISVGLFFSACTRNQIIAVLCSFVVLAIFTFLANYVAQSLDGWQRAVIQHLSIVAHFQDFARGLLDMNHMIFFVSTAALFLFLAVKVLESRRWR